MSHDPNSCRRVIVGIVGGVASGKSAVTQYLEELGGKVLNADKIAHEVLQTPEVIDALTNRFGAQVLLPSGPPHKGSSAGTIIDESKGTDESKRALDRSAIAKLVFGDTEQHHSNRHFLESIVQTRVRDRLRDEIEQWRNDGRDQTFLVLDVPLLFERGWERYCDLVLMVDTPDGKRLENATRRGWSEQDWRAREKTQMAVSEKRERATSAIPNDATLEVLRARVNDWHATHIENGYK